jgi:DNA-binding PadR family transcriptional regulator
MSKRTKPTRQKKLSAASAVCLGILSDYPSGMTLDDAVAGYEQRNLECERRAVCTYLHRVKKLGFIETKGRNATTTYHMTNAGKQELEWWKALFA